MEKDDTVLLQTTVIRQVGGPGRNAAATKATQETLENCPGQGEMS